MDPLLETCVAELDTDRWSAMLLDEHFDVVWVSSELQGFIGEHDEALLGYGRHIAEVLLSPTWAATMTEESRLGLLTRALPFVLDDIQNRPDVTEMLRQQFGDVVAGLGAQPMPALWTGRFGYQQGNVRPHDVQFIVHHLRDADGALKGTCVVTHMGVRPALLALLARGNEAMYERMARLVEPHRHSAAIMFCDLEASSDLARQLPTATYFDVIKALTSTFDELVGEHSGVVGKHAGDGMTAFFLVDDNDDPGGACLAALRTARRFSATASHTIAEACGPEFGPQGGREAINVGLHWGASLYIGQLVPGGRLDVTALGDEVNECARIQETASGGAILASKAFVECLPTDSRTDGLDLESIRYQPLSRVPDVSPKAVRDAGTLAVAVL